MQKQSVFKVCMVISVFLLSTTLTAFSQTTQSVTIPKSTKVQFVGGVKFIMHTVAKGQTLYAISKAYGRKLSDIVIENPTAIDGIKPGQILKIPTAKPKEIALTPIPPPKDTAIKNLHVVTKGQTMYSLSRQYGLTAEKLIELNPILKDGLKVGQKIITEVPSVPKAITKSPIDNDSPADTVIPKKEIKPTIIVVEKIQIVSDTTYMKRRIGNKRLSIITVDTIITRYDSIVTPLEPVVQLFSGEQKEEYNVAFFLPFHAKETDTLELGKILKGDYHLPYKSNIALQFYEGALLAIDSLKKEHLNATIFIYDIDDSDTLYIEKVLEKSELVEMDLMIGPLYGSNFMRLAKFAKEHQIPIVSPFTQINKILFKNPHVCKVLPSGVLKVEQMAHYVIDSFSSENIILVNNGKSKEVPLFNAFKNTANELLISKYDSLHSPIKLSGGFGDISKMLAKDTSIVNVIVLPTNSQSYITEFLNELNTINKNHKIVLFGLQSWLRYDNLDFEYLNNYSLHVPSNSHIDYTNTHTLSFIANYRESYQAEPQVYGYSGYDVTLFFVSALQKYGTGFLNNIKKYNYKGISANSNYIQSASVKSGFENKFVVILKYDEYKLIKAH